MGGGLNGFRHVRFVRVGFFQTFRRLSSMEAVLAGKSLKPTTRGVRYPESGIPDPGRC